MGSARAGRSNLMFILLLLTGIVLGGLIGELASSVPSLSFLNYGKSFILGDPYFVLDLYIVKLTFGLMFRLNVSVIIGIILAIIIYRKL